MGTKARHFLAVPAEETTPTVITTPRNALSTVATPYQRGSTDVLSCRLTLVSFPDHTSSALLLRAKRKRCGLGTRLG